MIRTLDINVTSPNKEIGEIDAGVAVNGHIASPRRIISMCKNKF